MQPIIIKGNCYTDERGQLKYNNDFNATPIKRVYVIENAEVDTKRGWQGHQVEQRWFSALTGSFEILLIAVDNWKTPNQNLKPLVFELKASSLDILHVPSGYISCIQSKEKFSKLLVMADYALGEITDEFRYSLEAFECTKNNLC